MSRALGCLSVVLFISAPVGVAQAEAVSGEAQARAFVLGLSQGKSAELVKGFDAAMTTAMPPDKLAGLWVQLTGQLLGFNGIKGTSSETKDGYLVVRVSCDFVMTDMDIVVVLNAESKISGLRVVSPKVAPTARPQTPKPPFPYSAREVLYANAADGSKIGGTLTVPAKGGPHPAVLLITGSGSQDRDETIFGHKPFWVIADHLTRAGFAVLRVDDRGVGTSTGDAATATIQVHATDVEAGVAFLKTQKDVDAGRIGLIGHSEGGIIAPIVAARSKHIRFIVSLAGPGVSGAVLNVQQVDALLPPESREKPKARAALLAAQGALAAAVAAGEDEAVIRGLLGKAVDAGSALASEADRAALTPEVRAAQIDGHYKTLASPWIRSFFETDPAVALRAVKIPVLALIGEKDLQVPSGPNLAAIGKALEAGGNEDFELHALPGLNHLFQTAKTGHVKEYGTIAETFSPKVLALITRWLRVRAGLQTPGTP